LKESINNSENLFFDETPVKQIMKEQDEILYKENRKYKTNIK